ncbi:ricin-type beta-trefoil lectin domain protein [Nonomuraea sp. NPDC050451]|uniref:ricin-type beta-trefoil lectin domain protein n=1 Tax=Nonomuraea sp. NPDC050451 TaxID=3364364 RepID=UPI00378FA088
MKSALPISAVIAALAATAVAAPAAASANAPAGAAAGTSAAAPPASTLNLSNRRTNLQLEVGDVGASGKGRVFSRFARGGGDTEQQWNFINGGKLVSRKLVRGQTVCLETDSGNRLFVARCVGGKQTQKWAFKLALNAPGAFKDAFVIQNFATKKCVTSAEANARRNAAVGVGSCKSGNPLQQWFAAPLAGD